MNPAECGAGVKMGGVGWEGLWGGNEIEGIEEEETIDWDGVGVHKYSFWYWMIAFSDVYWSWLANFSSLSNWLQNFLSKLNSDLDSPNNVISSRFKE